MKIMLIQAEPPDDIQDFNFPMGYASLDSVLTKHGHEVEILFTVAYHLTEKDIARKVKESEAQVVGIGGMWPYLKRVEMLVKLIREVRPDVKIVLGGWMVTYLPELVLRKTGADFCIAGEGEIALLQLIDSLEGKLDYSKIKGLVFKAGNKIINNGLGELMPLEEIPMPNWEKFPMEYYMRVGWYFNSFATGHDKIMGWATSRGCPGKCNFCTPGVSVRYKKMDLLMDELHEIEDRFHPTFMYWMDNLTMGSKVYCKKFCEALIKEKFKFRYFITGRVDRVDRETLRLLKESGCVCILYGLESANDDILDSMGKNITVKQVVEAVRLTKEAGIGVNLSAMFGQPGETIQNFYNTLKIILTTTDRKMPYSNNQGFYPLTTFPGSPIFYWAKEKGYIKNDEDYYNQFFNDRWINYTQYPRHIVGKVLNIANLLNTWNYHYSKALSLEDLLCGMQAASSSKIPFRSFAHKVKDRVYTNPELKGKIKKVLDASPQLKRYAYKLLGMEPSLDPLPNPVSMGGKASAKTVSTESEPMIDPRWDHEKQVDTFINLLIQEHFISVGSEKVQLSEEAGRLEVLAKVFFDKGDYEEAIRYYKMALERTPQASSVWISLGWAYQHTMRYDGAIKAFNEALKLDAADHAVFRGLGWAYYQKGVYDIAIQNFNSALEYIFPREKDFVQETYRGRGWAYFNIKKFDQSVHDFDKAIENTDPNNKAILNDLHNGRTLACSAKG